MAKKPLPKDEMESATDKFETIYESNAPLIYRFMFWRTKDQALAEDLTSSVFEKAWRTRGNFTGGSARAWLYKIAHTTLIDYWRKKKEVPVDDEVFAEIESPAASFGVVMDQQIELAKLEKAVEKLPSEMGAVVKLRFIEGLPVRQVAQQLDISEANARVIQYRALQKLRKYLDE